MAYWADISPGMVLRTHFLSASNECWMVLVTYPLIFVMGFPHSGQAGRESKSFTSMIVCSFRLIQEQDSKIDESRLKIVANRSFAIDKVLHIVSPPDKASLRTP